MKADKFSILEFVNRKKILFPILYLSFVFISGANGEKNCNIIPYRRYLQSYTYQIGAVTLVIFNCAYPLVLVGQSSTVCDMHGIDDWDEDTVPACAFDIAGYKFIVGVYPKDENNVWVDPYRRDYVDRKLNTCWETSQNIQVYFFAFHSVKKVEAYYKLIDEAPTFFVDVGVKEKLDWNPLCKDSQWVTIQDTGEIKQQEFGCPKGETGDMLRLGLKKNQNEIKGKIMFCELKIFVESEKEFPLNYCRFVPGTYMFTFQGKCLYPLNKRIYYKSQGAKVCLAFQIGKLAEVSDSSQRQALQLAFYEYGWDIHYFISPNSNYSGDNYVCPLVMSKLFANFEHDTKGMGEQCIAPQGIICEAAPMFCPPPDVGPDQLIPCYGRTNVNPGDFVTYECINGKKITGDGKRYCTLEGKWKERPKCV